MQALMSGPHTKVRVDHGLTSPEKPSKAARGALQTGLARFYKGQPPLALLNSPLKCDTVRVSRGSRWACTRQAA